MTRTLGEDTRDESRHRSGRGKDATQERAHDLLQIHSHVYMFRDLVQYNVFSHNRCCLPPVCACCTVWRGMLIKNIISNYYVRTQCYLLYTNYNCYDSCQELEQDEREMGCDAHV